MLPSPVPEIKRANLVGVVHQLKAFGIEDVTQFAFMDAPEEASVKHALELLGSLSALGTNGQLTRLGRQMVEFPLEPSLSKMLINSVELGCSDEVLTIVAMLGEPNVFERPKKQCKIANMQKEKLNDPTGDHLTLLNTYNSWRDTMFSSDW